MTNLEWIRTLSEEEFADWLYDEWLHHLQYRWSSSRGGLIIWLKDRKTEPTISKMEQVDEPQNGYQTFNGTSVYVSRLEDEPQTEVSAQEYERWLFKEPQTNADQHVQRVEYVGNDEKSRCWTCKHFERMHETPISSDGSYYTYVVCTASECRYEPKDEPQSDCPWK